MIRRLFNLAAAASLVLCAMMVGLWASSYFIGATSTPPGPRLMIMRLDEGDDYLVLRPGHLEHEIFTRYNPKWYLEDSVSLYVPSLVFLAIAISLAAAAKYLPSRFPVGSCRQCGYNLTGNASGICPECRTPIAKPPEAAE